VVAPQSDVHHAAGGRAQRWLKANSRSSPERRLKKQLWNFDEQEKWNEYDLDVDVSACSQSNDAGESPGALECR
jgi:hypothetical protein